jgi:hypothetical protein
MAPAGASATELTITLLNDLQRHDQMNFPNRVPEAANATFGEPFPQKFGLTPIGAIANIAPALSCLGVSPERST